MKISKHASRRANQRGINAYQLILCALFGEIVRKDKSAVALMVPEKEISALRQALDRLGNLIVIKSAIYNNIITTYHS